MTASENVVDHLHQLFFGELGMCGCGDRDAGFDLVRNLLTLVPQDEAARTRAAELIGTPGANHMVMSLLDHVGLIEHGTWIGYVWLTDKGRWYQRALAEVDSWDELEASGIPHDDRECTDGCWILPVA